MCPRVVDREDVGVAQGACGLGLPFESVQAVRVAGEVLGQDLDGDVTLQARIVSAVDLSHPAGSDRSQDLVRAEV